MGAQVRRRKQTSLAYYLLLVFSAMLPPMKSMKAGAKKAMTKGALTKALATEHGLKQKACSEVLNSIVDIATKEVKKTGVFTLHGLFRIKPRPKPATKAGVKT